MAQAGTDNGTDRPAMITAARGMDGRVTAVAAGDGRRPKKSRELRGLETSLNYSSDVQIHRVNAGRHGAVVPSLMSARNVTMTTSQVSMPRTYTIPQPTGPLYTDKNGKRLPMPGTGEPSTDTDDDDNECDPGRSWTLCTDDGRLLTVKKEMSMHGARARRRGHATWTKEYGSNGAGKCRVGCPYCKCDGGSHDD